MEHSLEDIEEALAPAYGVIASLPADHPEVRRLVSTLAKRSDIPEVILASVQLDVLCGHDLLADGDIDDDPGHWLAKFNDALADELKIAA